MILLMVFLDVYQNYAVENGIAICKCFIEMLERHFNVDIYTIVAKADVFKYKK